MSDWKPDAMNWHWVFSIGLDPSRLVCLLFGVACGLAVGALLASVWVGLGLLAVLVGWVLAAFLVLVRRNYMRERTRLRTYRQRSESGRSA